MIAFIENIFPNAEKYIHLSNALIWITTVCEIVYTITFKNCFSNAVFSDVIGYKIFDKEDEISLNQLFPTLCQEIMDLDTFAH